MASFGLVNGLDWLGNEQHVLGNGPHVFGNRLYYGEVRLGCWFILAPFGLGYGLWATYVLGKGPHLCTPFKNTGLILLWGG